MKILRKLDGGMLGGMKVGKGVLWGGFQHRREYRISLGVMLRKWDGGMMWREEVGGEFITEGRTKGRKTFWDDR